MVTVKNKPAAFGGAIFIILAELCFAFSTVFAKMVTSTSHISGIEITFFRFFLGIPLAYLYIRHEKTSFKPNNVKLVIQRGVLNTIAVIFFFLAVQYSTVTNANMLNMTYPVFIFIITHFFFKEKTPFIYFLFLIGAMVGITLVIHPDINHINIGDIFGLISGMVASLAVITLRQARKEDSTTVILFYLMIIGTILNALVMIPVIVIPDLKHLILMVISGIIAVFGQAFLTEGYKFIGARAGGILSSVRILYAVILGSLFFSESITLTILLGGILILTSIIGVGLQKQRNEQEGICWSKH